VVIPVYDDERIPGTPRPWTMWTLLVVSVGIFLFIAALESYSAQLIAVNFGLVPAFITNSVSLDQYSLVMPPAFTVLTYMFLHDSWLHLAGNMIFLWILGDNIEAAVGHVRFLLFYLLCGVGGAVLEVAMVPAGDAPIVGASGAVAGIVAAYLMLRPWAHVTVLIFGIITARIHAVWLLGLWSVMQVMSAFWLDAMAISFWAHIGGLVTGGFLILFLRKPDVPLFESDAPHVLVIPPNIDRDKGPH
jgi:membrane associated rhomboid family serine protease